MKDLFYVLVMLLMFVIGALFTRGCNQLYQEGENV